MIGKLRDLTINLDGSQNVTLTIQGDFRGAFDRLLGKILDIDIKLHRNRRSLDANGYAWELIDQIAARMHIDKVEVYREAIRSIGGVSDVVCIPSEGVDRLCNGWKHNGIGWTSETFPSKLDGCTNVILYYGSSVYDTKQMSLLIDHLVQDAEALGIPTYPPDRRNKLIESFDHARHKRVLRDRGHELAGQTP